MADAGGERAEVIGRRIGAGLIDLLVVLVIGVALALLIGDTNTDGGSASFSLVGADALVWITVALLYYGASEALTGQTIGKRLLNLRVAGTDGSRPGGGQIALRTVLRLIDGLAFYLVGLIALLASRSRRQRLGDLAARTTVVADEH
jgi:uncharacterized RDD family membrane protein YckC